MTKQLNDTDQGGGKAWTGDNIKQDAKALSKNKALRILVGIIVLLVVVSQATG